jgi:hypothetical protein
MNCGTVEKFRGVRKADSRRDMARHKSDRIDHHSPTSLATSSKVVAGGAIFFHFFGSQTSK